MKSPERSPKKRHPSKLEVLASRRPGEPVLYPEGDLELAGEKLYREAKGLRGAITGVHHLDLKGTDFLASGEELFRRTVGGLYHSVGYGVKTLDAMWEAYRFKQLQGKSGQKRVAERRAALESLESELASEKASHAAEVEKINDTLEEGSEKLNARYAAYGEDLAPLKPETWSNFEDAASDLEAKIAEIRNYRRMETEAYDTESEAEQERKKTLFDELTKVLDETTEFYGTVLKHESEYQQAGRKIAKLAKEVEKARASRDLPEAHLVTRERLLRDRDRLLHELHYVQMVRLRLQRKVRETGYDMRELFKGREPGGAREKREDFAVRALKENLHALVQRATPYKDIDTLKKHVEGKKTVDGLERMPLVRDLEKVLESEPLPEGMREEIYTFIAKSMLSDEDSRALSLGGRIERDIRTHLRYGALSVAILEPIQKYVDDYLNAGTETDTEESA